MAQISNLVFLSLEGQPPAELELPPLRTAHSTFEAVKNAFSRFAQKADFAVFCSDVAELPSSQTQRSDLIGIVYVMGHGWKEAGEYTVALLDHGKTVRASGGELLDRLAARLVGPAVLIIDTCSAGTLLRQVESRTPANLTCISASEDNETANEFGLDRSTRFAATLGEVLARHAARNEIEIIDIGFQVRDALAKPSLVPAQTVGIWSSGRPISLSATPAAFAQRQRSTRTYVYLRTLFIVAGALLATTAMAAALYYRDHVQVQLLSGPLETMSAQVLLDVDEERPDTNGETRIETRELIRNGVTRLKVPAADLVLVVRGSFRDGRPREIRFPTAGRSSFSLKEKFYDFTLPTDPDIGLHPNMAYVTKTRWLEGPDRVPTGNTEAFWIDLEPVTVEQYLPIAEQFVGQGKLESFQSVLLNEELQHRAINATNLKQIPKLMGQLQDIFDVVNAEQRATHQPDPANKTPLPALAASCPRCPARVTMDEAKLYCASRAMRLPTDLEWELAARGVDGRLYPWGNKFDGSRANVPGLPEKGQTIGLVAVDFYPNSRSPFGLLDTIGNAGDWVDSRGGYERTFMGGTFRFNKEDSLTYSSMPDTGDPLPLLPVTVRCVSSGTEH